MKKILTFLKSKRLIFSGLIVAYTTVVVAYTTIVLSVHRWLAFFKFNILNQVTEKEEMSFYDILIKSLDEHKADIVKLQQEYSILLDTITYDTSKLDQFIETQYREASKNAWVFIGKTKGEAFKYFCNTTKGIPLTIAAKYYLLKNFKFNSKKTFLELDLLSLQEMIDEKAWSDAKEYFNDVFIFKK